MDAISTSEAARMLGITQAALSKYIKAGKVPTPKKTRIGRLTLHLWSRSDVEHLRKLLPKIANGRKTRYKKKHSALSNQQSAKAKKKK
jgi:predicted transcriptional regulator